MYTSKIFTEEQIIELIKDHKKRVAVNSDIYQLAHDHIIRAISRSNTELDLDNIYIEGYRLKDLIVVAERLRKGDMEPQIVEGANEDFLAGYKAAHEEFNKALEESVNKIINGG